MKTLSIILLSIIPFLSSNAKGWDNVLYKQIESSIVAPTFADKSYRVTKYGASPKASAKINQQAINKAIAACSKAGGGKVIIPEGTYLTGAIRMQSNVNLVIEQGATLLFAYEPALYPLVKTRWEGLDIMNYSPCIYAYQAENIAISGTGTIDGNGSLETWWPWCGATKFGYVEGQTTESQKMPFKPGGDTNRNTLLKMSDNGVPTEQRIFGMGHGMRPQLVCFYECQNILIEGVTMLRSPFWVIHPVLSKNITVRNCKIINNGPNGDGCDPESCENVLIENTIFHTGDDCIAIKSGRNADGRRNGTPSQNIIIRGCTMEDGHGGVVVGSEISAGVKNVFAEDCKMDSPNLDRVLRIKTNTCRGGVTEGIYMRNIEVGQCREAVLRINLVYEPKEIAERGHIPTVRNVYMENVTCQKSKYGILLNGLEDADQIYNINVKNCTFNGVSDEKVRRTGKSHDIFFENLVINVDVVLAELPFNGHYSEWMTYSEMQRNPNPIYLDFTDPAKRPKGKWSYVMGIELESMLDTWLAYRNDAVKEYVCSYAKQMIDADGNTVGYKYEDFNLDNIRTSHFIYRLNKLFPQPGLDKALLTYYKQLENQPRTKEGVWWHKKIYHDQVWLDGIFMGLPFYVLAAEDLRGKKAPKYYDDAVKQVSSTFARTYDAATGLWKHAWDEKHSMFWANKETGLSQHSWARAMGWFVMAMTEIIDGMPENYKRRDEVKTMLQQAMDAVYKYQDKESGAWYDVLDVKDPRNYLESTASAMFTYVMLKGARLGYLDESYKEKGKKAYEALLKNFIRIDTPTPSSGIPTISLTKCCSVSGLGPESSPKRDGSFEYYMSEPIRDNDAKGIGPFIWAALEMENIEN